MFLSDTETRDLPRAAYTAILQMGRNRSVDVPLALHVDAEMKKVAQKLPAERPLPAENRALLLPLGALCRTMTAGVFGSGGAYLDPQAEIAAMLRPASVCARAGATIITGLRANLSIPRELTATSFSWLHELETISLMDGTAGELNLSPKRLGGATSISTQLDVQSGGILADFLIQSLAIGIGVGIDAGALAGSASHGAPLGLFNTPNVNTVTFGAAATRAKSVNFLKQITAADGRDENLSWVAHPAVKEKWQNLQRFSSGGASLWKDDNTVAGKPAYVSSSVPSTSIACGDFSKMIIAFWGADTPIQIIVNPFTQALAGQVQFVAQCLADVGILRASCFTISSDSAIQ
jgi:HK97 family phage major capsid protein